MSEDILSQDEIDALLTGVDSGEVETEAADELGPDEARAYDFTSQDRIVRGRLPTLDMVNERFARNFRISLFNFLRRSPTITAEGVKMNKFGEYIHSLFMPSNLNLVKIKPLRGTALFVLNPGLVYSIVDNFFGGTGKSHTKIEGRDFTGTEIQVVNSVLEKVFDDLQKAWGPIMELEFEHIGSEVNPNFANIVSPSEVVVVSTFQVELENGGGEMHMTVPYSMLEPIRDQLHAGVQSDSSERDERWGRSLGESIKMAPLVLKSRLTTIDMTLGELKALKTGDVLPIEFPEAVTATIEDVPVFKGSYGMSRGSCALKVMEVLNDEEQKKSSTIEEFVMSEEIASPEAEANAAADTPEAVVANADADSAADAAMPEAAMEQAPLDNLNEEGVFTTGDENLNAILDIPISLSVEIGQTKISIRNLLQLNQGSVVELDRLAGESLDVMVNNTLVAQGEIVVINEKYGIRLTDVVSALDRVCNLQ